MSERAYLIGKADRKQQAAGAGVGAAGLGAAGAGALYQRKQGRLAQANQVRGHRLAYDTLRLRDKADDYGQAAHTLRENARAQYHASPEGRRLAAQGNRAREGMDAAARAKRRRVLDSLFNERPSHSSAIEFAEQTSRARVQRAHIQSAKGSSQAAAAADPGRWMARKVEQVADRKGAQSAEALRRAKVHAAYAKRGKAALIGGLGVAGLGGATAAWGSRKKAGRR